MFKNYLITAWRNIIKNGVFSIINITGLALGLMSCILIVLFVQQETGFDKWLTYSDRIVRMHSAYYSADNPPFLTVRSAGNMMEAVRDYATNEVEDGVRFIQLTPPGSACSIVLGEGITEMAPGSQKGLQMVVDSAEKARDELLQRGVEVSDLDVQGWGTFVYFSDPDGNTWALQQMPEKS